MEGSPFSHDLLWSYLLLFQFNTFWWCFSELPQLLASTLCSLWKEWEWGDLHSFGLFLLLVFHSFWELLIKGYSMRLGLISSFRVYKNNFSIFTTSIFSSSNISPLQHFSTMMASLERGMMSKRVERPVTLDLHCFFSQQSPPVLNISE